MRHWFAPLALLTLTACATAPATPTYPAPANYEQKIKAYLSVHLFDPNSVMYHGFSQPRWDGQWYVCVFYNAKNRLGGYAGYSAEYATFDSQGAVAYMSEGTSEDQRSGCR